MEVNRTMHGRTYIVLLMVFIAPVLSFSENDGALQHQDQFRLYQEEVRLAIREMGQFLIDWNEVANQYAEMNNLKHFELSSQSDPVFALPPDYNAAVITIQDTLWSKEPYSDLTNSEMNDLFAGAFLLAQRNATIPGNPYLCFWPCCFSRAEFPPSGVFDKR